MSTASYVESNALDEPLSSRPRTNTKRGVSVVKRDMHLSPDPYLGLLGWKRIPQETPIGESELKGSLQSSPDGDMRGGRSSTPREGHDVFKVDVKQLSWLRPMQPPKLLGLLAESDFAARRNSAGRATGVGDAAISAWTENSRSQGPTTRDAQIYSRLGEMCVQLYSTTMNPPRDAAFGRFKEGMSTMHVHRSFLYVPGLELSKLKRALTSGSDAIVIDLEDSVPEHRKLEARLVVSRFLELPREGHFWLRVNPEEDLLEDDVQVLTRSFEGVFLPKVESTDVIERLAELLDYRKRLLTMDCEFSIVALLETARGILAAQDVARVSRVRRLAMGELDLTADVGVDGSAISLLWARSFAVLVSRSAELLPPVGGASPDFRDLSSLRESSLELKRLGFLGRQAIHPNQIGVIHDVFTPDPEEIAQARDVLERLAEARARGVGVAVDRNGRMIDAASERQARLALAMESLHEGRSSS